MILYSYLSQRAALQWIMRSYEEDCANKVVSDCRRAWCDDMRNIWLPVVSGALRPEFISSLSGLTEKYWKKLRVVTLYIRFFLMGKLHECFMKRCGKPRCRDAYIRYRILWFAKKLSETMGRWYPKGALWRGCYSMKRLYSMGTRTSLNTVVQSMHSQMQIFYIRLLCGGYIRQCSQSD